MIKNVIFDLGKVLIDYDFDKFFQNMRFAPNARTLDEANEEILLFESGKFEKTGFYNIMKSIYGFDKTIDEFYKYWCDVFWEIPQMIEIAKSLNDKFNLYIFSNTDQAHFPYIWEKFPSIHFFGDNLMLSHELGHVKPDISAFDEVLDRFSLNPFETLFIDDRADNIQSAYAVGFATIHHTDIEDTKKELKRLLHLEDK